jgi:hypothetical protein
MPQNALTGTQLTVSTAVSVLNDSLAPLGNFTLNVANEYDGRGSTIKVPVVDIDDTARVYNGSYESNAASDISTASVVVEELIKPFNLSDNALYKSPMNLRNYIETNANEFARLILDKVKTAVEGGTATNAKAGASFDLATVKGLSAALDSSGASVMDRHLWINASAHSNLLPTTFSDWSDKEPVSSGRFGNLYGASVHPSSVLAATGTGKAVAVMATKGGIVCVNRLPETQGRDTLQAFEAFELPDLGINVIYREHYSASSGTLYGCFSTLFGAALANPKAVAWTKAA